uniref:Uncharacterized protein n=1 Tax=Cucumis melo TaxID=3656 RepID=A0A9I9ECM1_CUCME
MLSSKVFITRMLLQNPFKSLKNKKSIRLLQIRKKIVSKFKITILIKCFLQLQAKFLN